MACHGLEHSSQQQISQLVLKFTEDVNRNHVYNEIIEDYSNALDVLRCLLHKKNHNIINELLSVSLRKSEFIVVAYQKGLEDGLNLKRDT